MYVPYLHLPRVSFNVFQRESYRQPFLCVSQWLVPQIRQVTRVQLWKATWSLHSLMGTSNRGLRVVLLFIYSVIYSRLISDLFDQNVLQQNFLQCNAVFLPGKPSCIISNVVASTLGSSLHFVYPWYITKTKGPR